jgi:hypothetical protein
MSRYHRVIAHSVALNCMITIESCRLITSFAAIIVYDLTTMVLVPICDVPTVANLPLYFIVSNNIGLFHKEVQFPLMLYSLPAKG